MLRLPPVSTLFPYTTLFRSFLPHSCGLPRLTGGSASTTSLSRPAQASLALRPAESLARLKRTFVPDRKSTHLNSSHVSISYALFSLKKEDSSYTSDLRLIGA